MMRMRYRVGRVLRRHGARPLLVVGLAGLLALAGCVGAGSTAGARRDRGSGEPAPTVSGHILRGLWQRPLGGGLVIDGGLVLSLSYRPAGVYAVSAGTGSVLWNVPVPKPLLAFGVVPGNGFVIVEAGREFGPMGAPGITQYFALDLRTGHQLWVAGVPGHFENPPIAISRNLVLTGDLSGAITARRAATGHVVWRRPPPSGCWRRGPGPLASAIALAADRTRVAASFSCIGYRARVQLLDPSNGKMLWSWAPLPSVAAQTGLAVTGVASRGDVVLLTGQVAPPAGPYPFARTVPLRYPWPASLGPPDDIQVVLTLDARTGRPRWIELGGQMVSFTLTDGAVCETVSTGMECRDDVTGALTGPVLVTGLAGVPSSYGDASAGITGSIAAVTIAPVSVGRVGVEVIPIRGTRPLGQAEVGTGTSPATATNAAAQPFVVAAGTLPDGRALLLLRRVDLPSHPVLALEVAARQ
jgi:outer membrane protein assembly factor BamB